MTIVWRVHVMFCDSLRKQFCSVKSWGAANFGYEDVAVDAFWQNAKHRKLTPCRDTKNHLKMRIKN